MLVESIPAACEPATATFVVPQATTTTLAADPVNEAPEGAG